MACRCLPSATNHLQALKAAILAENYAVDYTWYMDTILNLIRIAGNYGYAAKTVFELFPEALAPLLLVSLAESVSSHPDFQTVALWGHLRKLASMCVRARCACRVGRACPWRGLGHRGWCAVRVLAEPTWPQPVPDAAAPSRAGQQVAASSSLLLTQDLRVLQEGGAGMWGGWGVCSDCGFKEAEGCCWHGVQSARKCLPRLHSGHVAAMPLIVFVASQALQAPMCHENLVKVGGHIVGEFGNLRAGDPRSR
ncbi:hypothetical protein P7K49_010216 [Saguinus oedipus]|uniref:Uncharacterized protein n=1 Tax=Saguinus oedipus TaxID=9490 RepID=A0ABQ9VMS6_SAGOE|nr:hypothetical protein P7K49_010216 [Saguinus oedipus]